LRLGLVALMLGAGLVWGSPFDDGIAALDRGDNAAAFTLLRPLAAQGDANAQFRLSLMYGAGRGVPKNDAEALKWLRLAARRGSVDAQSNLGVAYSKGRGVAQDEVRAYAWFSISALAGNAGAASNREVVARRMTPLQIAQAEQWALQCRQRALQACD
jgi:TPR repeat protein